MPVDAFDSALDQLKRLRSHLVAKYDTGDRFTLELNLVIQNAHQVRYP